MCRLRDVLLFLAGVEFMHTLSHLLLLYGTILPLDLKFMVLTPRINFWAIVINAVLTVMLLAWAWWRKP
jgi:hypothetical protein